MDSHVTSLGHGIYTVDTGFQRDHFDAAYLIVEGGRAAFVDSGTNHSVPRLLGALAHLGLTPEAVDWVIPNHVHLDHAGGVGSLMQHLPQAQLWVHPRGARHMIDPSALYQGALAVYGAQEMARSYGELVPVPAHRVVSSSDGMTILLAGRPLRAIDTPGHAKHHHCIWDEASRGWFTGDTFGLSYREFDTEKGAWIFPTSTPVQFEPEALRGSIERLLAQGPSRMYLTHYSVVEDVAHLGQLLLDLLERTVTLSQDIHHRYPQSSQRHQALKEGLLGLYVSSLREHGCTMTTAEVAKALALDIELNAQGIAVWLDRPVKAA